jgi:hypothetical protein
MSAATRATTAQERADILLRMIRREPREISRAMADCLEMGDGDAVLAIVRERVTQGRIARELVTRYVRLTP